MSESIGPTARCLVQVNEGGRIEREGMIPADADGLVRLVLELGSRVSARRQAGSQAGSRTLRLAAVEAATHSWRPNNPFHEHYHRLAASHGVNPARVSVARQLLICTWHMLSRGQTFKPSHPKTAAANSSRFQTA